MDESSLIRRCRSGDLQAFGPLYDRYADPIFRFIFLKTRHRETAEDVTATAFMKALEYVSSFDPEKGSFKTWLFAIARNTVYDHFRSLKPTTDLEDAWEVGDPLDLSCQIADKLVAEEVRGLLASLSADQREIVLLRVWGEYRFAEIAEMTGKTEAACKMSFKRSLGTLKSRLPLALVLLALSNPF